LHKLQRILEQDIITINYLSNLFDDAARTERYIAKPKNPGAPSMYDLLVTSYEKKDIGYYKKELKFRASPSQISRWELAIEVLMYVDNNVIDNPIEARELIWMRAKKYKWTELARHFGYHRVTIKNRYMTILSKLVDKLKKQIKFDFLDRNSS
jgi:hypothetical protein